MLKAPHPKPSQSLFEWRNWITRRGHWQRLYIVWSSTLNLNQHQNWASPASWCSWRVTPSKSCLIATGCLQTDHFKTQPKRTQRLPRLQVSSLVRIEAITCQDWESEGSAVLPYTTHCMGPFELASHSSCSGSVTFNSWGSSRLQHEIEATRSSQIMLRSACCIHVPFQHGWWMLGFYRFTWCLLGQLLCTFWLINLLSEMLERMTW